MKARIPSILVALGLVVSSGTAQVFQELYSFTGGTDGVGPEGVLIQAKDGNFYGTASGGGSSGAGTVFKITPGGQFSVVFSFNGTNGDYPVGGLLESADGNFYGTTMYGGDGYGNVFKLTPQGLLSVLGWFGNAFWYGAYPIGDLAQGPDGYLYGVTTDGSGTIFRAATNAQLWLDTWYDVDEPTGGLLLASDGNFYGVTAAGGSCGDGSVYRLTTNGTFTTIGSLCQGPGNAVWPVGKLLQASDGNFYGAAGGYTYGTIFKLTLDGTLTTFARFNGWDGSDPVGGLVQAQDGSFYGSSYAGGSNFNFGTVYSVASNGTLSALFWFGETASGAYPYAGLVQGNDGNLYGTTEYGGANGGGNIFRIIMPGHECQLTCPTNVIVCNDSGQCGAVVDFGPLVTTNCEGYVLTYNPPSGSFFPVGTNIVSCIAVDPASQPLTNTCSFQVIVSDCEPPVIHSIAANPDVLWPPNGKMQPVTLHVSATDNCRVATCKIISVTSNERYRDRDRDDASHDWQITGDLTLNLRAETSGPRTERIYTITVQCADDSDNTSTAVTRVIVGHSGPRREQYGGGRH